MNQNNFQNLLDPYTINFFHDFMLFLRHLDKQPIKRTVTGAISLSAIQSLIKNFKQQEKIQEFQKYGWTMRREQELDFLEQIRIISEIMHVVYKRKGFYALSKNGKGFLENLDPLNQYKEMVLHYWYQVNWGYFSFGPVVNGVNLAEKLQRHQTTIWKTLLAKGSDWIDYALFCQSLTDYLHLDQYFDSPYNNDKPREMRSNIRHALFRKNIIRFGCVLFEEKEGKYKWDTEIIRFKSTDHGLFVYQKALYENYL